MIRFDQVSFSYDGKTNALSDVSLSIAPGEYVCILGGNGSGKSTLAKHINALLAPTTGDVMVADMNTRESKNTYRIRSTAGMVFQNPDDQLVASLVEDDVAFGPENLGVALPELQERVTAALAEVGLAGFERHETHALSGGQKQRVAIAGVLAMNPRILVLDEASAMLDPRGRKGLRRVCRELHERGMTIVSITHFMEEAADAQRVVALEAGRVVLDGAPDEVLAQTETLRRLNLDAPFAARYSAALRDVGLPVAPHITEDALVEDIVATIASQGNTKTNTLHEASESADANIGASTSARAAAHEPAASPAPLIEFRNVSYTYDADQAKRTKKQPAAKQAKWGNPPDALWALHNVNLTVNRGEFFGIAGHTGSGKSTLIQHMNGILRPHAGSVLVNGANVADKNGAAAARSTVGMVLQYPEHQLFADTVKNDVAFGPRNLGLSEAEVNNRVEEALARVGLRLADVGDKSPFALSGGQQRRVAFAGVLAMQPEALVLDEPTAGLDPAARASFLALIEKLHAEGLTIVMVSHSMDDLARLCDRVAVMNEGGVFTLGTPQEVFLRGEELNTIGLDVPAAQRVANRLREAGLPVPSDTLFSEDALVDFCVRATQPARNANAHSAKETSR